MLIFLIGLPGSGKTTLGKQLASLLGIRFCDLDHEIVLRQKQSIEEIFATKGENVFREIEHDTLEALNKQESMVIATGGGAPCFYNNMHWMKSNGVTIYLNPPLQELASRLNASKNNNRPMLKGIEDTLQFLTLKLKDREPYYSQAQFSITKSSPEAKDIQMLLQEHNLIP